MGVFLYLDNLLIGLRGAKAAHIRMRVKIRTFSKHGQRCGKGSRVGVCGATASDLPKKCLDWSYNLLSRPVQYASSDFAQGGQWACRAGNFGPFGTRTESSSVFGGWQGDLLGSCLVPPSEALTRLICV